MLDDNDDTKRITGRKIDLMIVDGVELSASEWKSEHATDKLIEDQRMKNYPSNCSFWDAIKNLQKDNE